jgi:hypothetical protein
MAGGASVAIATGGITSVGVVMTGADFRSGVETAAPGSEAGAGVVGGVEAKDSDDDAPKVSDCGEGDWVGPEVGRLVSAGS